TRRRGARPARQAGPGSTPGTAGCGRRARPLATRWRLSMLASTATSTACCSRFTPPGLLATRGPGPAFSTRPTKWMFMQMTVYSCVPDEEGESRRRWRERLRGDDRCAPSRTPPRCGALWADLPLARGYAVLRGISAPRAEGAVRHLAA